MIRELYSSAILLTLAQMVKKLLITTLIGTLVYFFVGWLVFDFILGSYTDAHTTQLEGMKKTGADFGLNWVIVSCAAYALLLSVLVIFFINLKQTSRGFALGAIVGILVAVMADTYWYGTSNFYSNFTVVLLDIAGAGLSVGVLGYSVTLVNKKLD